MDFIFMGKREDIGMVFLTLYLDNYSCFMDYRAVLEMCCALSFQI